MGHPAATFLAPPDANFKCAVCLDVYDDPVALLRCGHTFCRSCLEATVRQGAGTSCGARCPECRATIDLDDDDDEDDDGRDGERGIEKAIHPVRALRGAIGDMIVRCRNCLDDEEGGSSANDDENENEKHDDDDSDSNERCRCDWTGPLSSWPLHASRDCPVAVVSCPIVGCDHRCPRSRMASHVGSAECVEAAVASRVEREVEAVAKQLETQMCEEVEELRAENRTTEEANRALCREVKALRKKVASLDRRLMERAGLSAASENSPRVDVGTTVSPSSSVNGSDLQGESDKKKKGKKRKKRRRASSSENPMQASLRSSMAHQNGVQVHMRFPW